MELAPASDVYEVLDTALKTTEVRPGMLRVEREFGTLEIHGIDQKRPSRWPHALSGAASRKRSPKPSGLRQDGPSVDPYQAHINQSSRGSLLLAGQMLCHEFLGRLVMLAANEVKRPPTSPACTISHQGVTGGCIAGSDADVMVGREAAIQP
jgi:hypothetical protein